MSLPAREAIDPEYRFDLTHIFETPAEWENSAQTLRGDLSKLQSRADRSLDSPASLRTLLEQTESCYRRKQRLNLYATLYENVNTDEERADDLLRQFRELESEFEPVVSGVRRCLRETDDDRLDAYVAELNDYRRYAEHLRAQAERVRSPDAEDAIAAHGEVRSAPTRIIEAVRNEDFDPPSVERPDGETVELGYGSYREEITHSNREFRRRVYEAYRGEFDRFEHVLSRAFAEKLAAAETEADVRGYDSVRDHDFRDTYPENGLEPSFPGEVHEAMLSAVQANLWPYHRAQEIRCERLGVESLQPWDLNVSIADAPEPEIPYEEAKLDILDALAPLGDDYVSRTSDFFEERRIDVYPTQNKRTDIPAYCPSSSADGAFVLANYREDVRTASYVCHELGHALNVSYHSEKPTRDATCPHAICEIPSILHEILLVEHWMREGGALADYAENRLLSLLGGNFYNAAMYSTFVHRLAGVVEESDDLSAERIRNTYAELLGEFRPEVDYDDRAGRNWLGWGTRVPYCSFQYVLGATGALVVRDRLREGSLSPEQYHDFLRNTGSKNLLAQFETVGIDVTSSAPYERAAETFAGYLAEFD